jgi:hypothetical protein
MAKKSLTTSQLFEITDSTEQKFCASALIPGGVQPRDSQSLSARLSQQFINQNWGILNNFDVKASQYYDGDRIWIIIKSGVKVGAFPLLSPTSGKPDFSMIIKPRFEWVGVGQMLAQMGWRIVPTPLRLPLIRGTERKIPSWVLSSIILSRIQVLLQQLERRFELIQSIQPAPKGTVDWSDYATIKIPHAQFLQIPCQFPDLRDDRVLKSAIHFTLRKQLAGLESQRGLAGAVLSLIDLCQSLIRQVAVVPPRQPSPQLIQGWLSGPLRVDAFREGIQAVEWTVDDRGLAGLADLQGLPWVLPMDQFFEAWVETLVTLLSREIGGEIKVGRKKETLAPIQWNSRSIGTQKYLLPDVILERDDVTVVFDAKYKRHWEEFQNANWYEVEKEIQEQHRIDLFQVLAYSSLRSGRRIIACLVYPCRYHTWESLKNRGKHFLRGTIPAGGRNLEIVLTAVPMNGDKREVVEQLKSVIGVIPA